MQLRSEIWKTLAASGSAKLEVKAVVGGVEYSEIISPAVSRALCPDALSVGNCVSGTLQFSVRQGETPLPATGAAVLKIRFVDGETESEWMEIGTFYADRRTADPVTESVTFQGYDAMRKADAPFPSLAGFPKAMTSVVSEIAHNMGIEVDRRTWENIPTGLDFLVPLPAENEKMIKVLGYIGGVCGGNWIITPRNRLRLVPLISASGAAVSADRVEIVGITGKIITGNELTVTGVSVSNGAATFLAGDETGAVISVSSNPYMTQELAEALLEKYGGLVYAPYRIEKGLYDPAVEMGDYIVSRSDVASVVYQESARYGPAFRGDISAPFSTESGGRSVSDAIAQTGTTDGDLSVRFYRYVGREEIAVGDGESAEILNFDFAAGPKQDVVFHAEIKHETETTESRSGDDWTVTDAVLTVTYYINGKAVQTYQPVKAETDGESLLHLNYHWENGRYSIGNFRAVLSVEGGGVAIAAGDVRAYIIGQGYGGAYFDGGDVNGLKAIVITQYPKLIYELGEKLDLRELAVRAYYGDGTEADVTARCVVSPAGGSDLPEGRTTVTVTYAEDDTKPFVKSFNVFCVGKNGGRKSVHMTAYPERYYDSGGAFSTAGTVVMAYYGFNGKDDGEDVTEDCVFVPPDGTPLPDGETTVSVTYEGELVEEFTVYCNVQSCAWLAQKPTTLNYFVGEAFDSSGAVIMARENGVTQTITDSSEAWSLCVFDPASGTTLEETGYIPVNVSYKSFTLDPFTIFCDVGDSERGWMLFAWIDQLPIKTKYTLGTDDVLDLTGLVVKALFGDAEPTEVTEECALSPKNGDKLTVAGDNEVTVTYSAADPMKFSVFCGVESSSWIAEDGLVFVGIEEFPKMNYFVGEDLDLTGTVVKAYYGDGTEADVTAQCTFDPASGTPLETEGEQVVTVTYTEDDQTYTDAFSVWVENDGRNVVFIDVQEPPKNVSYLLGEKLVLAGLVVAAHYENGWVEVNIKPECRYNPAEGDSLTTAGTVKVDVRRKYAEELGGGDFHTFFEVKVGDAEVIKSKDWWTLYDNGLLDIYCVGDIPTSGTTSISVFSPYEQKIQRARIADGATSISSFDFYGCANLTSVTIPDSVTSIRWSAFRSCSSLTSVTIPNSSARIDIGESAFYYCKNLTDVTILGNPVYIGNYAFYGCTSLTSVTIPNSSAVSVEIGAFSGCSSLTSVDCPVGVSSVNDRAFSGCSSLTSVKLSVGIKSIGQKAFIDCVSLTDVTIPDSVEKIRDYAFANCTNLTSVTIPNSVTDIGAAAFLHTALTSVTVSRDCYVVSNAFPSDCVINYYD